MKVVKKSHLMEKKYFTEILSNETFSNVRSVGEKVSVEKYLKWKKKPRTSSYKNIAINSLI